MVRIFLESSSGWYRWQKEPHPPCPPAYYGQKILCCLNVLSELQHRDCRAYTRTSALMAEENYCSDSRTSVGSA